MMDTMAGPDESMSQAMVRGSVVVHRFRCGKPNCRCADDQGRDFDRSLLVSDTVSDFLASAEATALAHADLEERPQVKGRALLRKLFQHHIDLRAHTATRNDGVADAQGIACGSVGLRGRVDVQQRAHLTSGLQLGLVRGGHAADRHTERVW